MTWTTFFTSTEVWTTSAYTETQFWTSTQPPSYHPQPTPEEYYASPPPFEAGMASGGASFGQYPGSTAQVHVDSGIPAIVPAIMAPQPTYHSNYFLDVQEPLYSYPPDDAPQTDAGQNGNFFGHSDSNSEPIVDPEFDY